MIEVRGLHKRFGKFHALRGIDFDVPRGALCGFIGPNGAGKTTTMRILATLELPSAGSVRIAGLDSTRAVEQVRRLMGYMPDYYGTYPDLTAGEYLDFFARAQHVPSARRPTRLREVIDFVEIEPLLTRPVEGLSKGQRQRLSLARALLSDPELLILDEPAAGLDPRARVDLRELLKLLAAQGKTVFISSHILSELSDLVNWVVIIDQGQIRFAGRPDMTQPDERKPTAYEIELCSDATLAQRFLMEQPGMLAVDAVERGLIFQLDAHQLAVEDLIVSMVQAGVRFRQLQRRQDDLEAIFMRVVSRRSDAPAS
ncbi:MAG: putative transporter ATP-binding protein YbhF [Pseudomonadota bacterium]